MAISEMERMNRRRKRQKKRRLILFALLSPVLVALCVWGVNALLRVEVIAVQNSTVYDTQTILSACDLQIGDGLFSAQTDKLEKTLPRTHPYVDSIRFRLSVPNKIYIDVTACEPALTMEMRRKLATPKGQEPQYEYGWLLLDKNLKVLDVSTEPFETGAATVYGMCPEVFSLGGSLDRNANIEVDSLLELLELLEQYKLLERIDSVDLSRKYDIKLQYNGVICVELGNFDDMDKKIEKLDEILSRNDPSVPAEISVSYYRQGRYRQITE